jgi:hypothetical protein
MEMKIIEFAKSLDTIYTWSSNKEIMETKAKNLKDTVRIPKNLTSATYVQPVKQVFVIRDPKNELVYIS